MKRVGGVAVWECRFNEGMTAKVHRGKRSTIRSGNRVMPGDGLRLKDWQGKTMTEVQVYEVSDVEISATVIKNDIEYCLVVNQVELNKTEKEEFAEDSGFDSFDALVNFFFAGKTLPGGSFNGQLIEW